MFCLWSQENELFVGKGSVSIVHTHRGQDAVACSAFKHLYYQAQASHALREV